MAEWIDITRTLTNGIVHWPTDPPFRWQRLEDITGPGTANVSQFSASTHIGTHVDAPLHFIEGGADITEVPLSVLCGPALVIEVRAERDIEIGDIDEAGIRKGDRVLFRTVNARFWDRGEFEEDFHAISGDAAMWLVDHGVQLVGVDYLSIDGFHSTGKPAHYALLGNGVIVVESLDLSRVEPGRYEMVALPLKIAGSEAAPARVIVRAMK